MKFTETTHNITLEELRQSGATKWANSDDSIGAFVAEMDFGIAPCIKQALHEAVDEGAFGYLPKRLTSELQETTAEMLSIRYHWKVKAEDVRPVPDVIKALELAIKYHSEPGSKIIVPTPAYMPFLLIPKIHNREVIEVPMLEQNGSYSLDLEGLQNAFDNGGNLLVLCNPYNPVGRVFTHAELSAVAEVVGRNKGRVFADEIWAPLIYDGKKHTPYASINDTAAGHTITAISASKAWNLPGLKCAQVITSNDRDREVWERIGFLAGHGTSNLGVVANISAYKDGFVWLEDVVDYLDHNRRLISDLVTEKLPGVRYNQPEGTYIAWLDFRNTPIRHAPAALFKTQAGVHLTEGSDCGANFSGFTRFIFATPRPIMELAFERMSNAMKNAE